MVPERVAMLTKALRRKEVELGFVQIPVKDRPQLFAGLTIPFDTQLNDLPAMVDKKGRLWCREYLKKRFTINAEVTLTRKENGFQVTSNEQKQEPAVFEKGHKVEKIPESSASENRRVSDSTFMSTSTSERSEPWYKILEGDCIKYLNEREAVRNVHLTFFDPPYLQGKDYRYFDDQSPKSDCGPRED